MDFPATEWLSDEVGDLYRIGDDGEREYKPFVWGEDPEFDAWMIAEVEQTIAEVDAGSMPLIDNEEVERRSKALLESIAARKMAKAD
jgi:hypothetical protein